MGAGAHLRICSVPWAGEMEPVVGEQNASWGRVQCLNRYETGSCNAPGRCKTLPVAGVAITGDSSPSSSVLLSPTGYVISRARVRSALQNMKEVDGHFCMLSDRNRMHSLWRLCGCALIICLNDSAEIDASGH